MLLTHGACEAAWDSLSPTRSDTPGHGGSGHALQAMMRCVATEHPQISWRARDTSSAQPAQDLRVPPTDTAAELLHRASTVVAPLLVPCIRERKLPDMVGFLSVPYSDSVLHAWPGYLRDCTSPSTRPTSNVQGCGRQINWMISGGLGALGALMAAWLARGGCGGVSLLSRSGHFGSQDNAMRHLLCTQALVTMERYACTVGKTTMLSGKHVSA